MEPTSIPKYEAMRAYFREQARVCDEYGSPFTARLIEAMWIDFEAGGPVAELIADWPGSPLVDALTMRLAGALHAAVLTGRDPALAAEYPEQRADYRMDAVWPLARALFAREQTWVTEFMRSPPQTNEVRRSIALLPGFLAFAETCPDREFDMLEIGASAGLNLGWDRFSYRTDSWSWGPDGGVPIDTDWHGPPPPLAIVPRIRARAACDQNPLDINDRDQRLRLRSYVWADQPARLARFDGAVELARARAISVERADAAEWLARRLPQRAPDRGTIVYHSLFLQYPLRATRAAIIAAIESAGARATPEAPFAWLRLEPEGVLGGPHESPRFLVDMITWPGAVRRTLAVTDGHARAVHMLAADPRA
ncbi:MAG TPA: DUF2332 family protein [Polyangiales bacterium]|nr:DUF2332 family protein [Polyangiales bacterium]